MKKVLLCTLLAALIVTAQEPIQTVPNDSAFQVPSPTEELDSTSVDNPADSSDAREGIRRLRPVRRDFNYRRQVRLALFMMGFVAVMITSAQTWNPR